MRQIQFRLFAFVLLIIQPSLFNLAQTNVDSSAQESINRTVATIRIKDADLTLEVKYSDVLFQLAATPDASISPPTPDDFGRALQFVIDQRLIEYLAVEPYPAKTEIKNDADYQRALQLSRDYQLKSKAAAGPPPTEAEINETIKSLLAFFPSAQEFEKRLRAAGFISLTDNNFRRRMEMRILIERLIDFRFRSRVVITRKEEEDYYQNVFVPEFKRRYPGKLIPELEKQRPQIRQILPEQKTQIEIRKFLVAARKRIRIGIPPDAFK